MSTQGLEEVCKVYEPTKADKFLMALFDESEANVNYLKGRVLTVIDATSGDVVKREAVKDLIHQAFQDYFQNRYYPLNTEISERIKDLAGETSPNEGACSRPMFLPPIK